MKIPYTELDMRIALINVDDVLKTEENALLCAERINEMVEPYMNDKAKLNKEVAETNGIQITDLIASPNYETLVNEFKQQLMNRVVEMMKADFGLSDVQAWGLLFMAQE